MEKSPKVQTPEQGGNTKNQREKQFFGAKVFHHQFFITQDLLSLIFFNNKTARNGLEMNCSRQGTWCSPRNYGSRGTWKYRFVIPTFIRYKKDMIPTSLWCFLPTTNTPFLFFGDTGASQWWRVHRLKTSFHSNHHKLTNSNPAQCSEKFRGQFGEFLNVAKLQIYEEFWRSFTWINESKWHEMTWHAMKQNEIYIYIHIHTNYLCVYIYVYVYVYVYVYIYIMQIYIDKKTFFNNMMFFHVFPIQADVQVLTSRRGETPGGALPWGCGILPEKHRNSYHFFLGNWKIAGFGGFQVDGK